MTIITRTDGAGRRWAYQGHPLYTFSGDTGRCTAEFNFNTIAGWGLTAALHRNLLLIRAAAEPLCYSVAAEFKYRANLAIDEIRRNPAYRRERQCVKHFIGNFHPSTGLLERMHMAPKGIRAVELDVDEGVRRLPPRNHRAPV